MATYSTITCPATDIGSTMRIVINKADSSYWHTLSYKFGKYSGNITTGTSATYFDWVVPTGFYTEIPDIKQGSGTITCTTYNSNTQVVGTHTASFIAKCNEEKCKPTLNPTVVSNKTYTWSSTTATTDTLVDTTTITGDVNTFVRYYSNADFTIGAAARNSATIVSQRIECGSQAIVGASGTMERVDNATFTFVVEDSRGFVTKQIIQKNLIEYSKPTVYISDLRIDGNGNATLVAKGTFFNGSLGAKNNSFRTVEALISKGGINGSKTMTVSTTTSGHTFTVTGTYSGLDYSKAYLFKVRVLDQIALATVKTDETSSTPIFNWGETDFEFNVDLNAEQNLSVGKNITLVSTDIQGDADVHNILFDVEGTTHNIITTSGSGRTTFGDEDVDTYVYGDDMTVESSNDMSITSGDNMEVTSGWFLDLLAEKNVNIDSTNGHIAIVAANGSVDIGTGSGEYFYINGEPLDFESGTWSPKAYGFTREEYEGNYIRIGEMCIISFFLEGTVKSYDDMFTLYNLPYDSDGSRWWAGGGNLSGHFVNEGWVFTGWVVEADGDLYARTSAVGTTDGQYRTSSYAGQDSGDTIIASGTIMYRIDPDYL